MFSNCVLLTRTDILWQVNSEKKNSWKRTNWIEIANTNLKINCHFKVLIFWWPKSVRKSAIKLKSDIRILFDKKVKQSPSSKCLKMHECEKKILKSISQCMPHLLSK